MKTVILKPEQLNLPEEIAKKLKGKEIELLETEEGILLRPMKDPIKRKVCRNGRRTQRI